MPLEPSAYGSLLYRVLHAADVVGVDVVIADMPPDEVRWSAVRDRLSRASA
jgi:hypothetical protein